jgi:antitoxin component of MazEF toxin-antitoxin module
MQIQLKKVPGGYELFISEELATGAGLTEGQPIEVVALADQLVISNPDFVRAAREAFYARITPETLHTDADEWSNAGTASRASK